MPALQTFNCSPQLWGDDKYQFAEKESENIYIKELSVRVIDRTSVLSPSPKSPCDPCCVYYYYTIYAHSIQVTNAVRNFRKYRGTKLLFSI